ncbi:MAG: 16S rRNA (cytidine(1402)-2'-O)-methyltransferase [Candidatus Kapabacteria bacterium]|nr:16S rRNA (cytidine(1402)-2'-O)-methyltransferase [Candidatus Kapabacteria bacterium]
MSKESKNAIEAALYIVPTPIGNLEDITLRSLRILKEVDIIACEDTRRMGQLLKHYGIQTKRLESYYEQNELIKSEFLIEQIRHGFSVALTSDAGTPGLSDPGFRIISKARENNIKIIPLPGATSIIPALVGSGFSINKFKFVGFPPHKKGRQTFLSNLINETSVIVILESPNRIIKLLNELSNIFENKRKICLARELTKIYEEFIIGFPDELILKLSKKENLKGEFVVVIDNEG